MSEEMLKKVEEWLDKHGYPLEFATQHIFDEAGFSAAQGFHVRDPKTGAVREVDVAASVLRKTDRKLLHCTHIVECKANRSKPWVAFTRPIGLPPRTCIEGTIGNQPGRDAIKAWSEDKDVASLRLFERRDVSAFAGVEALKAGDSKDSGGRDAFYSALQSVVTLSTLTVADWTDAMHVALAFPVIVLGGELVTASFDMKQRKMVVAPADEVRFHWVGAEAWDNAHVTIDVVTEARLPKWAEQRKADIDKLLSKLAIVS